MEECPVPSVWAIAFRPSPFFQRSQISALCADVNARLLRSIINAPHLNPKVSVALTG
jgi:hypothetical protein